MIIFPKVVDCRGESLYTDHDILRLYFDLSIRFIFYFKIFAFVEIWGSKLLANLQFLPQIEAYIFAELAHCFPFLLLRHNGAHNRQQKASPPRALLVAVGANWIVGQKIGVPVFYAKIMRAGSITAVTSNGYDNKKLGRLIF